MISLFCEPHFELERLLIWNSKYPWLFLFCFFIPKEASLWSKLRCWLYTHLRQGRTHNQHQADFHSSPQCFYYDTEAMLPLGSS